MWRLQSHIATGLEHAAIFYGLSVLAGQMMDEEANPLQCPSAVWALHSAVKAEDIPACMHAVD